MTCLFSLMALYNSHHQAHILWNPVLPPAPHLKSTNACSVGVMFLEGDVNWKQLFEVSAAGVDGAAAERAGLALRIYYVVNREHYVKTDAIKSDWNRKKLMHSKAVSSKICFCEQTKQEMSFPVDHKVSFTCCQCTENKPLLSQSFKTHRSHNCTGLQTYVLWSQLQQLRQMHSHNE